MTDMHSISIISFVWPIQVEITLFLKAQLVETRHFFPELLNFLYLHSILFQAPPKSLVDKYLDAIAKTYDVPFEVEPDAVEIDEDFPGDGAGGGGGGGGRLIDFSEPTAPTQEPKKKEAFMYPPPAMNVCTWAVHYISASVVAFVSSNSFAIPNMY